MAGVRPLPFRHSAHGAQHPALAALHEAVRDKLAAEERLRTVEHERDGYQVEARHMRCQIAGGVNALTAALDTLRGRS